MQIGDTFIVTNLYEINKIKKLKVSLNRLYEVNEITPHKTWFKDNSGRFNYLTNEMLRYVAKLNNGDTADLDNRDLDMLIDLALQWNDKEFFLDLTKKRYWYL